MKIIFSTILIMLMSLSAFAQVQEGLNSKEFLQAKKQLEYQLDSLEKHKPLDDYNGGWIAKLEKDFYLDTFYIENLWELEIKYNGSTMGMNQATHKAEKAYDELLNDYYGKLLDILQGEDKALLKTTQRNWIKFRDSEKQLNYKLAKEEYSGGGTIHSIFVASRSTEITRQRVFELHQYLDRIWQPTKKK